MKVIVLAAAAALALGGLMTPPAGADSTTPPQPGGGLNTPSATTTARWQGYAVTGNYQQSDLDRADAVPAAPFVSPGAFDPVDSNAGMTPMGAGSCELSGNTPEISWKLTLTDRKRGIWFDGQMQCGGVFVSQQTCAKLQELDNSGSWYKRTNFHCGDLVAGPRSHGGKWVSCAGAGEGFFRTAVKGVVDTGDQGEKYLSGHSSSAHLCG